MRLPGFVPATLVMLRVGPADEVNVHTVGFGVGLRVNVRPWASGVVVRLLPPPGAVPPAKSAPSSAVTGLSRTPLLDEFTKTLICWLAASKERSLTLVTQRCRTGEGTEP